jgi:hypothetical protein
MSYDQEYHVLKVIPNLCPQMSGMAYDVEIKIEGWLNNIQTLDPSFKA